MRTSTVSSLLIALLGLSFAAQAAAQYYGDDRGSTEVLRCESYDGRTRHCPADTRGGVRLIRQLSRSACLEGRTWGADRRGVWVTQGCRAEFALGYGGGRYGDGRYDDHRGYPDDDRYGDRYGHQVIRCESFDGRSNHCAINTRGRVELSRQLSRTACVRGRNWGTDRRGIWVGGGCRADFRASTGWRDGRDYGSVPQVVRCESQDGRQRYCPADARGGVRLVRQLSRTPCTEGRNWGRDHGGIWVAGGCRGDFEVGYGRDEDWGRD